MNRWPGKAPSVSYGDNMSIKYKGVDINANQNLDLPPYRSHKITEISPNSTMPEVPKARISANLQANAIEYIPVEILTEPLVESRALELPDVYDYTVGDKLSFENETICWANHDTINWIMDDQITRRLCVKSPILQLDALNDTAMLLRTRQGLGVLNGEIITPILSGNTVDMARHKGQLAISTDNCLVNFYDLTTGKQTKQTKYPRSTVGGFNRMAWGSSTQLFYVDHNNISLLDLRSGVHHNLRDSYNEHLMAVRDIVARDNNVFALESTNIVWYDTRQPSKPVLEIPHNMKRNEASIKLDFLADTEKLLLSSHVAPFNTVISPGQFQNFPVLNQNPYTIEIWPTIGVQSQISRENGNGYDMWISSSAGGLFKQTIAQGSPTSTPRLGPTEPSVEYNTAVDFVLDEQPVNSRMISMNKIFEGFNTPKYRVGSESSDGEPIFTGLGYKNVHEFDQYNRSIWLDCVPDEIAELRKPYIETLRKDMESFKLDLQELPEPQGIHSNILDSVKTWVSPSLEIIDQGSQTEPDSSLPQFGFTQPEPRNFAMSQTHQFPSSQPIPGAFAFSQPGPSKKKRKRTKHKDGFA